MVRILLERSEKDMEFIKGTILGMVAGACIGYIKNDMIYEAIKNGKKEFKKMKRKISF